MKTSKFIHIFFIHINSYWKCRLTWLSNVFTIVIEWLPIKNEVNVTPHIIISVDRVFLMLPLVVNQKDYSAIITVTWKNMHIYCTTNSCKDFRLLGIVHFGPTINIFFPLIQIYFLLQSKPFCHTTVNDMITTAGTSFGCPASGTSLLHSKVLHNLASLELVRLVNSATLRTPHRLASLTGS